MHPTSCSGAVVSSQSSYEAPSRDSFSSRATTTTCWSSPSNSAERQPRPQPKFSGVFLAAWEAEEKQHFRLEEEFLLLAYAAHGDPGHPVVMRMLQDHMLIRREAARLANDPSLDLLHDLGNRLADHVRLEERELFLLIEETVPESELQALRERPRLDTH